MIDLKEYLTKRNNAKLLLLGLRLEELYFEFSRLPVKLWLSMHRRSQWGVGGPVPPFLKGHNFTEIIQKLKCQKTTVI